MVFSMYSKLYSFIILITIHPTLSCMDLDKTHDEIKKIDIQIENTRTLLSETNQHIELLRQELASRASQEKKAQTAATLSLCISCLGKYVEREGKLLTEQDRLYDLFMAQLKKQN